jgi:hypothetical protein
MIARITLLGIMLDSVQIKPGVVGARTYITDNDKFQSAVNSGDAGAECALTY